MNEMRNPEEIQKELDAQIEEEKTRTTFTKEMLELVVSQFALSVLKSNARIKMTPESFKFLLEEYQTNSAFMKAGNPVEIHIRMQDLADALIKKGKQLYEFKKLIENCLLAAPKLLHTLAVVPVRDIAVWNAEVSKFKWHKGTDQDFLPKLLPDSEIHYDVQLRIIAVHVPTDTRIVVNDRKMDLAKLRREAREILSAEVNCPTREEDGTPE